MSEHDDLLAKLRQTLDEHGIDSFHILEDLVSIEEQMKRSEEHTSELQSLILISRMPSSA